MTRVEKILEGIANSGRVAGAYLFLGPIGADKKTQAEAFADDLDVKKQDRFTIAPAGASLKIDQIRELQTWVRYGPSASKYLVAIVAGADTLTDQAAAAFLKTLEEPAPGVVFILLAEREDKMLPTILSRCQKIIFSDKGEEWQPNEDHQPLYEMLKGIKRKRTAELLKLSADLQKEKEKIEALLYDLAYFVRKKIGDAKAARIILDTMRYIKRRANLKLALDVMCLKLGEKND
jgi:DNA polymerase III gamma/tau subunit